MRFYISTSNEREMSEICRIIFVKYVPKLKILFVVQRIIDY